MRPCLHSGTRLRAALSTPALLGGRSAPSPPGASPAAASSYAPGDEVEVASAEDMEVCCVCLDSLSSAPVAALLGNGGKGHPGCHHFLHAACAERLRPRRCPLCRIAFSAPSAPISQRRLRDTTASEVLAGIRRLAGLPPAGLANATVPARTVVHLLAAVLPLTQESLRALVAAEMDEGKCGQEAELREESLTRLLARLRLARRTPFASAAKAVSVAPADTAAPQGYSLATRVSRRLKRMLLRLAGAGGAAVHVAGCGVCVGMVVGSLAALPRLKAWEILDRETAARDEWRALLIVWLLIVAAQLGWHSFKDPRWVKFGCKWGALLGALLGWLHALVFVDPDNHGFISVFRAGLIGRTTWPAFWSGGADGSPRGAAGPVVEARVDVFAPAKQ